MKTYSTLFSSQAVFTALIVLLNVTASISLPKSPQENPKEIVTETVATPFGIIKSPMFPDTYPFDLEHKWLVGDDSSKLEFLLYRDLIELTTNSYLEFLDSSQKVRKITPEDIKNSEVIKIPTNGQVSISFRNYPVQEEALPFWFYFQDNAKVQNQYQPIREEPMGIITSTELDMTVNSFYEYIWIIKNQNLSRISVTLDLKMSGGIDSLAIGPGVTPNLNISGIVAGGESKTSRSLVIENKYVYIMLQQHKSIWFQLNYTSIPIPETTTTPRPTTPTYFNPHVDQDDINFIDFLMRGFKVLETIVKKADIPSFNSIVKEFTHMANAYCEDKSITLDKEITKGDVVLSFMACKETCRNSIECLHAHFSIYGTVNDSNIFTKEMLIEIIQNYWSFENLSLDMNVECSFNEWAIWSAIIILVAVASPTLIICKWKKCCSAYKSVYEKHNSTLEKKEKKGRFEILDSQSMKSGKWNNVWDPTTNSFVDIAPDNTSYLNPSYESTIVDSEDEDELFSKPISHKTPSKSD